MKATVLIFLLTLVASLPLSADPRVAGQHMPEPELVGKARLKVMFWRVFDAELYAPEGSYRADRPYALSLSYLREIESADIVSKSIQEIRSQGQHSRDQLSTWKTQLAQIIPDVDKRTTITGVRDEQERTRFYRNGTPIGDIDDPLFTRAFFNIWLGENTSKPEVRKKLLKLI